MNKKIPMYKTINVDILTAFERKVPRGQRTAVLESLMLKYISE